MILYCCCHDVDDDTDSHTSSSRSCFGSFYFAMNISSRDVRINATVADILGTANNCNINITTIDCTPTVLMKSAAAICSAIDFWALPFVVQDAFIDPHGELCFSYPEAVGAPIDEEIDDSLPF